MEKTSVDRVTLLNITIIVEACLLLVATVWAQVSSISLPLNMVPHFKQIAIGVGAGTLTAAVSLLLFRLGKSVDALAPLREIVFKTLVPIFSETRVLDLIFVAALSGFCEEVFFRGIVQSQFGLFIAALAFGLFHDPTFRHVPYAILAFLSGLFLGWLYMVTGNLWVPITAHTVHNLISLYILRFKIKPPDNPLEDSTSVKAP